MPFGQILFAGCSYSSTYFDLKVIDGIVPILVFLKALAYGK